MDATPHRKGLSAPSLSGAWFKHILFLSVLLLVLHHHPHLFGYFSLPPSTLASPTPLSLIPFPFPPSSLPCSEPLLDKVSSFASELFFSFFFLFIIN